MSLNTAHANGGVLIYSGERILLFYDGASMNFEMTSNLAEFKGTKKGRIYLTTHRVIFNSKNMTDQLGSFAMPFYCMRQLELEQPIFGANYIKGQVLPEPSGNWEGEGRFKIVFKDGGAIEFGQAMLQAGKMATRQMPQQPPVYVQMANSGPYYVAPPPAYAPPSGPQYGFLPYKAFPNAPSAESVYTTEAPPPYPGIDGQVPPMQGVPSAPPSGASSTNGHDAKAAEAAQAAYYNPANPHNVYMPQQYPGQPPAYSPSSAAPPPYSYDKKDQ